MFRLFVIGSFGSTIAIGFINGWNEVGVKAAIKFLLPVRLILDFNMNYLILILEYCKKGNANTAN